MVTDREQYMYTCTDRNVTESRVNKTAEGKRKINQQTARNIQMIQSDKTSKYQFGWKKGIHYNFI